MSADTIRTLDADGATALPRSNGELVFEAPWQSRVFGAAVALQRSGALKFEEFRAELIEEIQAWQLSHDPADEGWAYYQRWQGALERVLGRHGLVSTTELEARAAALARAWSHDH
jgi:nitrile hydratase accessory protein